MARFTLTEELSLGRRIQEGDLAARNQLIEANIGIVAANIRRYLNRGSDEDDIESAGYCGMLRAAESYDPARGLRFSTHAVYWVRECMKMECSNHGRTVRVPHHRTKKVTALQKAKQRFFTENGKWPTDDDLEEISFRQHIELCDPILGMTSITTLEYELSDVDGQLDHNPLTVDLKRLHGAIRQLPSSQQEVLNRRFGLQQDRPETLDEVSKRLDCPKTSVQYLERAAIDHLKDLLQVKID